MDFTKLRGEAGDESPEEGEGRGCLSRMTVEYRRGAFRVDVRRVDARRVDARRADARRVEARRVEARRM
jgi:hypothetical protein